MTLKYSFILFSTALLLSACSGKEKTYNITVQSQNGSKTVNLIVEVSDTVAERRKGLMNRESLPEYQGMLFAFDQAQQLSFWMQDTLISLDIMFFDANGVFINAFRMDPCDEDSCPSFLSAEPAVYALEVNAGFREEQGIGPGWKLNPKELRKIVKFE